MDIQLAIICLFTLAIHLIGTLAFAVRIAAVRTRKVALAFALFNILALISRTCNSFQVPFLAKRLEVGLLHRAAVGVLSDFRWIILGATLGSVLGAVLIPTFQRLFTQGVYRFQEHRSMVRLLFHGFSLGNLTEGVRASVKLPGFRQVRELRGVRRSDLKMFLMNVVAVALLTVGVLSALYAGYLEPAYRVTASSLSAVVNGLATLLMFIVIDPHLSVLTDDVMEGSVSESDFRRTIVGLVGARIVGTCLAQVIFLPAAAVTGLAARWL